MKDVQCPYCDTEIELCHDDGAHYGDDNTEDEQCPECDQTFQVTTNMYFTHSATCADDKHDWEKGTNVWEDREFTREHNCVGETYYWIKCKRENCDEGEHLTKEEYDAHSAEEVTQ